MTLTPTSTPTAARTSGSSFVRVSAGSSRPPMLACSWAESAAVAERIAYRRGRRCHPWQPPTVTRRDSMHKLYQSGVGALWLHRRRVSPGKSPWRCRGSRCSAACRLDVDEGVAFILSKTNARLHLPHGPRRYPQCCFPHQQTVIWWDETQRQRPPSGGVTEGEHGVPVVLGRGARGVVLRQESVVEVEPSRRR